MAGHVSGGWLVLLLVAAALLEYAGDPITPSKPRTPLHLRRIGLFFLGTWLVVAIGAVATAYVYPLETSLGTSGGEGGRIVNGISVHRYHEGRSFVVPLFAHNGSVFHDLTITGVRQPTGDAPWTVRPSRPSAPRGWQFGNPVPVRIPANEDRDLSVQITFSGCTSRLSGETFTLRSVPLTYETSGTSRTGSVALADAVQTTCPNR